MLKKLPALLILLFVCIGFASGQAMLYRQTQDDFAYNGYPYTLLPGSEWNDYVIPVFNQITLSTLSSVVYNSGTSTVTIGFPSAHGLSAGSVITLMDAQVGATLYGNSICEVTSAPTSTTITIYLGAISECDSRPQWMLNSAVPTAGSLWIRNGTGFTNQTVTWEIIDQGTTAGKYFIRAGNNRSTLAAGTPCTPDQHTSTCYISHPILTNAFPALYFEVDPSVVPVCSYSGSPKTSNLVLNSTVKFTVKATMDYDPTKTSSRQYYVCAPGAGSGKLGVAKISGGYEQMWANEDEPLYGHVFGNSDQYMIWSVIPDVGGGSDAWVETVNPPTDALIKNGGKLPEVVIHSGTVTNTGFQIQACTDVDPTSCFSVRRFVSATAKPPANADGVILSPCDVDPVMTGAGGTVYEIGAGQTYPDLTTLPNYNFPWGSIFRIHPGSYPNYIEFAGPNNTASFSTNKAVPAYYICGMPDPTTGALPIIEGSGAFTVPVNCNPNACKGFQLTLNGLVGGWSNPDVYTGNMKNVHHVGVANLRFQNANETTSFYPVGQSPPSGTQQLWFNPAINFFGGYGIRTLGISNYTLKGIRTIDTLDGILTTCNSDNNGWHQCSEESRVYGSRFVGYGVPGSSTEHAFYNQDWGAVGDFNRMEGSRSQANTLCFSMRTDHGFFTGNRCTVTGSYFGGGNWGGNTELQDNAQYYSINQIYGTPGTSNCSGYPMCDNISPNPGVLFGAQDTVAAFTSQFYNSTFMFGNAFQQSTGGCTISIAPNHPVNGSELQHNIYYYYNLADCPSWSGQYWLETTRYSNAVNGFSYLPVFWPNGNFINNVMWWDDNSTGSFTRSVTSRADGHIRFQTNVFHSGQFTPTQTNIPFIFGNSTSPQNGQYGLNADARIYIYTGALPIEWKYDGFNTTANFIQTSTQPYNSTTLKPVSGSASLGVASALPYPASLYPPLYNAIDMNGTMARRNDLTIAGPYDLPGAPTLVSIAVTPNPANVAFPGSIQLTATGTYSDASTANITNSCAWSNSGSIYFHMDVVTPGLAVADLVGSGMATCTLSSIPGSATVNVNPPPPASFKLSLGVKETAGTVTR